MLTVDSVAPRSRRIGPAGVTSPEQVVANASATGWRLTPDDLAVVDAIVAQEGRVS
jgi:hypothetical protein